MPRRCDVEYISFSAHADYLQTRSFIRQLKPGHVVLVHGAEKEMKRMAVRLKTMLMNEREEDHVRVDTPRNTQKVFFEFLQTKVAKIIGKMAEECESAEMSALTNGSGDVATNRTIIKIKGILINQNFSHKILSTSDIKTYTDLTVNKIQQKMHVPFWNRFELVEYFLGQVFDHVERIGKWVKKEEDDEKEEDGKKSTRKQKSKQKSTASDKDDALLVEHVIRVVRKKPDRVLLQWNASPTNDMLADACVAVVRSAESGPASVRLTSKICSCSSSNAGGDDSEADTPPHQEPMTLQERQLELERGMRNVMRFTFNTIAVDLVEKVTGTEGNEEGDKGNQGIKNGVNDDRAFDTILRVVADGVAAVVKCTMMRSVGTKAGVVVEGCADKTLQETLRRVTTNVMSSIAMRGKA